MIRATKEIGYQSTLLRAISLCTHVSAMYMTLFFVDNLLPGTLTSYIFSPQAHPLKISLTAGQALYLPSLWFHHVGQNDSDGQDFERCTVSS